MGKGKLVEGLQRSLGTIGGVLCCDDRWKLFPDVPMCTHGFTGRCYELPDAVDFGKLCDMIRVCVSHLAHASVDTTLTQTSAALGSGPVYLLVEGFVLFASPELVTLCHELLWLDADCDTCSRRRFFREMGERASVDDSVYTAFRQRYAGHTFKA